MSIMIQLVKRNMRLYLRDRASVFFSFLSVIIIILLYFLFLGDMQVQSLQSEFGINLEGIEWLVNSWIMAGVLTVSTITVPLGLLGSMIRDRQDGKLDDFYVSPINRTILALGYLVSTWVISLIMVIFNFIVGQLYIVLRGGEFLGLSETLIILGLVVLSIIVFSSIFYFVSMFLKTENSFGLLSTLVGTFVGFLGGIYIPIGVLSQGIQNFMNILPIAHAVTLIRNVYMTDSIDFVFGNIPIAQRSAALDSYSEMFGLEVTIGNTTLSMLTLTLSLVVFGIVFYLLSVMKLRNSKL